MRSARRANTMAGLALATSLALVVSGCSGDGQSTAATVVSIVEVPGEPVTVTSVVTEVSIVEVPAPTTTTQPDPTADWPKTLILGVPNEHMTERVQASLDQISSSLGEALGVRVLVSTGIDAAAVTEDLAAGRVDFAPLQPTDYVAAADLQSAFELLAQSVRFGDATYHSQWFTNDPELCGTDPIVGAYYYDESGEVVVIDAADSPALQVGWNVDGTRDETRDPGLICPDPVDLSVVTGKTIAFTTETSVIGFILPTLQLRAAGITNDQYTSLLAGSHDFSVAAVYDGDADIGVSFNDARLTHSASDVGSRVIVFNLSARAANDVFVARSDLPESLKDALFDALVGYIRTPDGQAAMSTAIGWTDMRRADAETVDSLLTVAAAMHELGFTD